MRARGRERERATAKGDAGAQRRGRGGQGGDRGGGHRHPERTACPCASSTTALHASLPLLLLLQRPLDPLPAYPACVVFRFVFLPPSPSRAHTHLVHPIYIYVCIYVMLFNASPCAVHLSEAALPPPPSLSSSIGGACRQILTKLGSLMRVGVRGIYVFFCCCVRVSDPSRAPRQLAPTPPPPQGTRLLGVPRPRPLSSLSSRRTVFVVTLRMPPRPCTEKRTRRLRHKTSKQQRQSSTLSCGASRHAPTRQRARQPMLALCECVDVCGRVQGGDHRGLRVVLLGLRSFCRSLPPLCHLSGARVPILLLFPPSEGAEP